MGLLRKPYSSDGLRRGPLRSSVGLPLLIQDEDAPPSEVQGISGLGLSWSLLHGCIRARKTSYHCYFVAGLRIAF